MSQAQAQAHEPEEEFDLEIEGEEPIEVVDTTPEADRGKQLLPPEKEDLGEPDEDEIASYSERVQKRIKDATFKFHDQRRKREGAERERDEAVRFAQAQLDRARQMEAALYQYEAGFVDQAKTRVEAELSQAQADYKAAFEIGNADKMAEAQAKLARLAVQQEQYGRFQPRQLQPDQPQVQMPAVRPRDDDADRYQSWVENNKWFEQDETLRDFAMGIHTRIAASDPASVGSDDYYREIEGRVKAAFPNKFEARPRTSTPPVTGVTRATGAEKARKTVKLSKDQMSLCRRLGITPQDYVREMLRNGEEK